MGIVLQTLTLFLCFIMLVLHRQASKIQFLSFVKRSISLQEVLVSLRQPTRQ